MKYQWIELQNYAGIYNGMRLNQIKIDLNTNNILTKQSIETSKQLSEAMDSFKETMIEMGQSLKDGNRISSELAETVKNLNDKVDNVENKMSSKFSEFDSRIESIDDKSKIDILAWIKNNWFGCVMGIGALVYVITQFIN